MSTIDHVLVPLTDAEYDEAEEKVFAFLDGGVSAYTTMAAEEAKYLFGRMIHTIQFAKGFGRN